MLKRIQVAAARTKQREEEKHTGIRTEKKKKKKSLGKSKKIVLKASMVTPATGGGAPLTVKATSLGWQAFAHWTGLRSAPQLIQQLCEI